MRYREDLLDLLTLRSRMISERQLDASGFGRRLPEKLVTSGWLMSTYVYATQPPELEQPLACWCPGDPEPDFANLSYVAKKRSRGPTRRIKVYIASKKAGIVFGGRGGPLSNPLQGSHDLACTSVYLLFLRQHPERASFWLSEDVIQRVRGKKGQRIADAMIHKAHGKPACAVEFIGTSYSKERIASFCRDCSAKNLPFLLW